MLPEKHNLSSLIFYNLICLKTKHTEVRSRMVETYFLDSSTVEHIFFPGLTTVETFVARVEHGPAQSFRSNTV